MKIRQWELSCTMQTERQMERDEEAKSGFLRFCERALKIQNANPYLCP
jgi:hypothetical protein